ETNAPVTAPSKETLSAQERRGNSETTASVRTKPPGLPVVDEQPEITIFQPTMPGRKSRRATRSGIPLPIPRPAKLIATTVGKPARASSAAIPPPRTVTGSVRPATAAQPPLLPAPGTTAGQPNRARQAPAGLLLPKPGAPHQAFGPQMQSAPK